MNKRVEQFLEDLQGISLSGAERSDMRDALSAYANMHAADATVSFPETRVSFLARIARMPAFAVLLVLVSGGGVVSFAAERALPGDPLYPIKTSLNEELRGAFALSPENEARWSARRAARRLEEAEQLAARGELDARKQAQIEQLIDTHIASAVAASTQAELEGDAGFSRAVSVQLERQLFGHADKIAVLLGEDMSEGARESDSVDVKALEQASRAETSSQPDTAMSAREAPRAAAEPAWIRAEVSAMHENNVGVREEGADSDRTATTTHADEQPEERIAEKEVGRADTGKRTPSFAESMREKARALSGGGADEVTKHRDGQENERGIPDTIQAQVQTQHESSATEGAGAGTPTPLR